MDLTKFCYLGRAWSESVRADAFESSLQIRARSIATYVRVDPAFVLVHAFLPGRIQDVSDGTFTPVGSVRVYALTTVARICHEIALVQVFAFIATADTLGAQFRERFYREKQLYNFTRLCFKSKNVSRSRAFLPLSGFGQDLQNLPQPPPDEQQHSFSVIFCRLGARQLPAKRTFAMKIKLFYFSKVTLRTGLKYVVTLVLSRVYTFHSDGTEHEPIWTVAIYSTIRVDASPSFAHTGNFLTFVYIFKTRISCSS